MKIARIVLPLALALAPLAMTTAAHADLIDTCSQYHDIEVSVHPYVDACANYPWGPIGS